MGCVYYFIPRACPDQGEHKHTWTLLVWLILDQQYPAFPGDKIDQAGVKTERQIDRQAGWQTGRQRDRQANRLTGRQTDRLVHTRQLGVNCGIYLSSLCPLTLSLSSRSAEQLSSEQNSCNSCRWEASQTLHMNTLHPELLTGQDQPFCLPLRADQLLPGRLGEFPW